MPRRSGFASAIRSCRLVHLNRCRSGVPAAIGLLVLSLSPGFALKGEVLFFAPPKKSTQKKRGPAACPLPRVPCASRYFERSPDSQYLPRLRLANPARQGGSLALKIPAMLGCANGVGEKHPIPWHSPSTAASPGTGARPVRGKFYGVGLPAP